MSQRRTVLTRVLLVATCAATFIFAWVGLWRLLDLEDLSDVGRYERYANLIAEGEVPYLDFSVEYPPGALTIFLLPQLASWLVDYEVVFQILLAACGFGLVALTVGYLRSRGEPTRAVIVAASFVATAPFVLRQAGLERFDLWPAALTAAAVASVAAARHRSGAVLLGLAAAVKLYPLVIVPLALLHVRRREGGREAAVFALLAAAALLAFFMPFLLLAPAETIDMLAQQYERPLQLESLAASTVLAAHVVAGVEVGTEVSYGSVNVVGGATEILAGLSTLVLAVVLAGIWIGFARSPVSERRFVVASAAAVTALLALGKVLSPQFLLWSVAPVVLIGGQRRLRLGLLAGAVGLTGILYPTHYEELARAETAAVGILVTRNLLLVGLLVVLVRELAPHPASSRRL